MYASMSSLNLCLELTVKCIFNLCFASEFYNVGKNHMLFASTNESKLVTRGTHKFNIVFWLVHLVVYEKCPNSHFRADFYLVLKTSPTWCTCFDKRNEICKIKNVQEIQDERFVHQDSFWNGCTDVTSGTPLEHFFTKIFIFSDIVEWHYSRTGAITRSVQLP